MSAAAHLAPHAEVTVLEMEHVLAYHTTGRSAAVFVINYGEAASRALARASRSFLENPPEGSTEGPLVTPRGVLWVSDDAHMADLRAVAKEGEESGAASRLVHTEEATSMVPVMRSDWTAGGIDEPDAMDIDVASLHQAYVRIARSHGAAIRTDSRVTAIRALTDGWRVDTGAESYEIDAIVNAAGAWGDDVAGLAGVDPIGLQPMRRTAFMVPGSDEYSAWPMVVDVGHRFYFKPDGPQILCSLAEENPSEPTDPKPRMEDVALAIDRINEATTLGIRAVNSEWTGLRTFAPDRELVIGEDPTARGFFWLAGQGGTGILTSPGYGSLLASLVTSSSLSDDLISSGVDPTLTDPRRFR
jgi:D-arginine dehydrogenase